MGPQLVFVHGIGSPRNSDDTLSAWLAALEKGARAAGHSRRVPDLMHGSSVTFRFAHYGDLFRRAQAQGHAPDGDDEEADSVTDLLLEALDERPMPVTDEERRMLRHARDQLTQDGEAQGPGAVAGRLLSAANTLTSLPGLRGVTGWTTGNLMVGQLRQVARYLRRGEVDSDGLTLDARIRGRVEQALDPVGPSIVIAHSLGTVVAMETLRTHRGPVPLLVTLGSPIGLRATVGLRMRPQPLQVPSPVERWLNYWDRDDLITGDPRLERMMGANDRSVLPISRRVDSDGLWVHSAVKYLAQPAVAGPVVEAIETAVRP